MEPILTKTMRFFRKTRGFFSVQDVAERLKEDIDPVEKAIKELYKKKILAKKENVYRYIRSKRNEELVEKIFEIYDRVEKRPKIEMIVRALLTPEIPFYLRDPITAPFFLFHFPSLVEILKTEGFYPEEIGSFIEDEMKKGWMGRFEFYFGSKEKILWPSPLIIHPHYFINQLRRNNSLRDREMIVIYIGKKPPFASENNMSDDEFKRFRDDFLQRWKKLGWFVRKEQYIAGHYPRHIARRAREFIERERKDLKEKILKGRLFYPF